jgi:outer membrane protein assembly factor BamA
MWVTEQRTNWVSAAAGYSPGEPLNGTAQIRLLNLLGTGRRLEAGWRAGAGRTSYELGYTEPWVLRSAVDMTAAAEHQVYDTTYAKTTFSLGATAPAGSFVVSLSGGWEQVAMNVAGRVQTAWVGTGVEYDSRDSRWNPGHGSRLAVATRAGQRVAADSARSSVVRAEVRTEVLAPLGVRFAWANSVNGRAVVPEAGLAEPELYHLGGANSVRGFDEDAYTTSRAAWVSTEFRYRLSADAYVYPFVDAAVFDQDGARNIMAYGVGGRWQTRVGRLGLDYGIAAGEALLHGKVHLSFEGGF